MLLRCDTFPPDTLRYEGLIKPQQFYSPAEQAQRSRLQLQPSHTAAPAPQHPAVLQTMLSRTLLGSLRVLLLLLHIAVGDSAAVHGFVERAGAVQA
jgi:hypothetical protein